MGLKESEIKGRIARSALDEVIIEKGKYWGINVVDIRWYKDNLDGRLLSKIIKRRYLRHKTYDLFLDIMDKEYPNHVKYYPRKNFSKLSQQLYLKNT